MKRINRNWILVSMLIFLFLLFFNVTVNSAQAFEKPIVYTTFYPTKYFAERIGGELIQVINPVPSDSYAIFWMPDAKTIQADQKADLIILNCTELQT